MKTPSLFLLLSLCLGACAGGKSSDGKSLDDCPEVADFRQAGNDPVLVVQLDKVKDTLDLPLSRLLDDFRIVPLDNREEALTKGESVTACDNYVGMGGSMREPYRLFDRKGRFVCQVGANGQGPSEYWAVYDSSVDEAHDRVYLMPWNAKSLLVYNLKGEYLSSIPLPTLVPKGVFSVDTEKRLLTVGLLPFADIEGASVVWQQDFEGNVLHWV
ncbi:MAG: 6-bladed beta-propeller, partial [Bacteroides sp.]|nr:6-bladed beta-propeller [Bacteroides sp.]